MLQDFVTYKMIMPFLYDFKGSYFSAKDHYWHLKWMFNFKRLWIDWEKAIILKIYYCRIFNASTAWNLIIMLIYAHRDVIISDVSHNKTNQLKDNFVLIKNIYGYMGLN